MTMDAVHNVLDIIAGGGWNGLLVSGFLVLLVMALLTLATNKYLWASIGVIAAAWCIARYTGYI